MANVPITSLPEAASPSANDYLILQGKNTQRIKWSALLDKLYPVGCIYQSASSTSPASFLGGTWEQIKDRFILAAGDTYAAGSTGGSATHDHTVSGNASIGVIQNTTIYDSSGVNMTELSATLYAYTHEYDSILSKDNEFYSKITCAKTKGNADERSNMPPYTTVYVWKRIA